MTTLRVLLVDDEFAFSELTKEYLEAKGFNVRLCHQPGLVLGIVGEMLPDLCILDVKMPEKDGFTLATEIRAAHPEMPLIFLTGQSLKDDRIKGLMIGADDYISKPFSMEELYLRILAIMKRYTVAGAKQAQHKVYQVGQYEFDSDHRELRHELGVARLTAIESRLLNMLCEVLDGVLYRDKALKAIWGDNDIYKGRSMNVYITKLRQLLKHDANVEILNVHGEGYSLVVRKSAS